LRTLAIAFGLAMSGHAAGSPVVVWDSLPIDPIGGTSSGSGSYVFPGGTNTFIGAAANLAPVTPFATNLAGVDVPLYARGPLSGDVTLDVYVWDEVDLGAGATSPAFSNLLRHETFHFGALNISTSTLFMPGPAGSPQFAFSTPVVVSSLDTVGFTFAWKLNGQSILDLTTSLTTVSKASPSANAYPTVGSNPFPDGVNWYRNVSGESDGNFLGGSKRTNSFFNTVTAFRVYAVPSPSALSVLLTACCVSHRRRR